MWSKIKDFIVRNKRWCILTAVAASVLFFVFVMLFFLVPIFGAILDPEREAEVEAFIAGTGFMGPVLIILLQFFQVVTIILPGEPVFILSGAFYGHFIGLLLCVTGTILSSLVIFLAVRKWGYPLVHTFFKEREVKKYSFLQKQKNLRLLTFILFFIPGSPKDILTYVAPLTPISLRDFLIISTIARIPTLMIAVFTGKEILDGNYQKALIVTAVMVGVILIGMVVMRFIFAHYKKNDGDAVKIESEGQEIEE